MSKPHIHGPYQQKRKRGESVTYQIVVMHGGERQWSPGFASEVAAKYAIKKLEGELAGELAAMLRLDGLARREAQELLRNKIRWRPGGTGPTSERAGASQQNPWHRCRFPQCHAMVWPRDRLEHAREHRASATDDHLLAWCFANTEGTR
jgi:hypothetical protein